MKRTFIWKDIECIIVDNHGAYETHVEGLYKVGGRSRIKGSFKTIREAKDKTIEFLEERGERIIRNAIWEQLLEG